LSRSIPYNPAMRKVLTLVAGFVAVLLAGGCITDPVTGESVIGMPASDSEEAAMGLEYRPSIVQEFDGPYPDAQLQQHLGSIVLGMARQSVRPSLPWAFTVLNSSVPNAFAVPGGQVFVTRGLLTRLEDEAEFAVVMGHEIGHVEHRHSMQGMGREVLFQTGAAAVGAAAGDGWGEIAGYGAGIWSLSYSRDDERESDVRGVENSYAAGYDPREGADVFREFLKLKQEAGGGAPPAFLSSHPADEERIENIQRLCAQKDPRLAGSAPVEGLRKTTPAWAPLVARLRQEQRTYDKFDAAQQRIAAEKGSEASVRAALEVFRQCERELPGHAVFAANTGKALVFLGDTAGGRAELERASSMNQQLLEPEVLLGELALAAKDWTRAAAYGERGLALLPSEANYPSLLIRGAANWNLGRRAEAEKDLRAVMQVAPQESAQWKVASSLLGAAAAPATTAPAAPVAPGRKRARK
jgi:predicted Zn-dependent protease